MAAFNVINEFVEACHLKNYTIGGVYIDVSRGLTDDLSISTTSVLQGRIALKRTEEALKWCRMRLKASKSRSLVIQEGVLQMVEPFQVGNEIIPGLHKKPLRTLGRNFDGSLNDSSARIMIKDKFQSGLLKLDKSVLTGFMKAWVMHHILLHQIRWDLMIYEVPISFIEALELKQNVFARKWLGLPKSTSDVALYSKMVPCPLPLKSIVTLFKEAKVGSYLQLQYSKDSQITRTLRAHRTGLKWGTEEAIARAEKRIEEDKILGNTRGMKLGDAFGQEEASSRLGLGFSRESKIEIGDKSSKDYRVMVTGKVQQEEEDRHMLKAVNQALQGSWTKWQHFLRRDISWRCAFASPNPFSRFCVSATYNTLPTKINLERWGMIDSSKCSLCGEDHCSVRHILSGCKVSLHQGRYLYRHNQVLRVLAHHIQSFLNTNKVISSGIKKIHFVKEGSKEKKGRKPDLGILHRAKDFELNADLNKLLKFPNHIAEGVSQRPDIVIYSNSLRLVLLVELTCPCEERFQEAHSEKSLRYRDLVEEIKGNGWDCLCFPVEVGARGYCSTYLKGCLRKLGLGKKRTNNALKEAGDTALRSSYWIWLAREQMKWEGGRGFKGKDQLDGSTFPVSSTVNGSSGQSLTSPSNITILESNNEISSDTSAIGLGVRGLLNCGNTCFINAVLQTLNVVWHDIGIPCQEKLGNLLHEAIKHLNSDKGIAFYPVKLVNEIRKSLPGFQRVGAFEDAHEFMLALLDKLGCLNMCGSFESTIRFTCCPVVRVSDASYLGLQLPIPEVEPTSEISLQQCVTKFKEWERLEKLTKCPLCSKMSEVDKQISFVRLPKILVVQLVRFSSNFCKNSSFVKFTFDYSFHDSDYKLVAVINHLGSAHSGHYTSSVRIRNKWFNINDDCVTNGVEEDIISKDAYILIYESNVK